MIQELFTVPLYQAQLDLDTDKLRLFCIEHENINLSVGGWGGETVEKSNVGGYQSDQLYVESDECLNPLFEEVENHATKFAPFFINDSKQNINNAWFNINYHKDSNRPHMHPGCDISGVYYVNTPEDCGVIRFENPAKNSLEFTSRGIIPQSWNNYNSRTWWMPAVKNTLYLFPCWLYHFVEPNKNKTEERISFGFNTIG